MRAKFTIPSKIQAQALPIVLSQNRSSLIGQAHHGSGATAAFSLGIPSVIDPSRHYPQALVLCPTRELAVQISDVIRGLAQFLPVQVFTLVPSPDKSRESINAHVIVGTPGSVDAAIGKRLNVTGVIMFVADEADGRKTACATRPSSYWASCSVQRGTCIRCCSQRWRRSTMIR